MNKGKKSKALLVLFALIMVYAFYTVVNQQIRINEQRQKIADVKGKIAEEKKLNEDLQKQKQEVNSKEYIEKAARQELGMVKDGEKVYVDINK